MSNHIPRAVAPRSLQPVSRGWPDAYGFILLDDTRLIFSFDGEDAARRGLQRVGHVWAYSAGQAVELCVSLCGCCADIRPIEWLDDRAFRDTYPTFFWPKEPRDEPHS